MTGSPQAAPDFAGRYALTSLLKSGHGVETHRAVDVLTGQDVVVKTIDPSVVHTAARLRFEHEARVLRELSGVGLCGLHDAGLAEGRLYLVQPFVPGDTLEERLRAGRLELPAALSVAIDVANALDTAHAAGVCHRDVKPANIVLTDGGSRATLIDFGFARSAWLDATIRDDLVGTVRYLAPESAGMLGGPSDERSDLYALGVVLFEVLTGRPPFRAESVGDLLRQHLSTPVPDLLASGLALPRALDAIVQRLLRKEPGERYQSAGAVAADLVEVLRAVTAGDPDPRVVIGRLDARRSLTEPAFVGREVELETLTALVAELHRGPGALIRLEAESGGGKTRLLTEVVQQARQKGVAVLHGQGVQQAAQRPFTLLHGVAEDLVAMAQTDDLLRTRLRTSLADVAPEIARALPLLAPVLGVTDPVESGPEQFGEQRSLTALHRLLAAAASPGLPVLLVLDDCQWSDTLTVRLLAGLATPPAHLGVVAAYRSEEVSAAHALRGFPGETLQLGPLSASAIAMLAQSMAGPLPEAAIGTLVRLSDGSPFMAAAVLRGMVECDALRGGPDGWVFDAAGLTDVQTGRRSAAFLVRRLELLPDAALDLLSVGAVLGKVFDVSLAVQLSGSPDTAAAALEDARRRRLLWIDERTGRCSFFHDKIREALLELLDEATRKDLHARAADALVGGSVFELAYHLDAAGRSEQALPHALTAAALARTQHALDSAIAHYRMAARGVDEADVGTRIRIAEGLGDVLTLQGVYAEAEEQLSTARGLVRDRIPAAALDGKLGDLAFKRGDVATAKRHLEGAMAGLGRPVPRSSAVLVVRLVWELLVQAGHTVFPSLTGRRAGPPAESDVLAMRLYSRLAYLYWFHSGKVPCGWAHLRGMNLAERYPPSAELGQAYSEHAPVMTMIPWYSRGVRYAERSLQIRRDLGDGWGQGQSLGFAGVVLYAASRYEESLDASREAVRLLERTGDRWEGNTAGWHIALALYRTGQLPAAIETAREVYAAAQAIGDSASRGIALSAWTRASVGRIDPALIRGELDKGGEDAHTTSELHLADALCQLRAGELDRAEKALRAAVATVRRAGLRQEYIAPVFPWLATVLRMQAEDAPAHNPALRRKRLAAAAVACRRARRWAFSYRNNAPHALRESALVASLRGRRRTARRLLARSLAVAEAQGAAYEAALTRMATAELDLAAGGPMSAYDEARSDVVALESPEATTGPLAAAPTMSLFDRFTTLLKVGRTITAAGSRAAVEAAVREAALTLLRGERCHLVDVLALSGDLLTTQSGESVDEVSRSLLRRAVELGEPVAASDPNADDSESLLLAGIRSVLAAPITVHGQTSSLFYVTHRQVGQLFGEQEVQLAAFIATLAGAAFEHLEGSEARFRSLAQNSSDVLTLLDRHGTITYQSSAVSRVFALSPTALVGRDITEWVHPDDLNRFVETVGSTLSMKSTRIECRFAHADGTFRVAETAVTNLLDDPTVAALVLNTRDVTDRHRLEEELRERALHDELTGLPNRALFLDRATQAIERGRRRTTTLVVAFLDLDDFKAVNDTLGHGAGDALLCTLAERLQACLRPQDTVARFGGDEFAILLEDTDQATAERIASRILEITAEPVQLPQGDVVVHASIGLAVASTPDVTPEELLSQADSAMYAAKGAGKDRLDVFAPEMRTASETRSRLRVELDTALAQEQFRLHYQPMVDLGTGAPVGAEALIRWAHPERGLLVPADFIDYAEESAQIVTMGTWVLARACDDAGRLGDRAHVSVNVSARQLQHLDLAGDVSNALETSGLRPERLILEITETATVTDTRGAIAKLREITSLGVRVALDDFGTGYSPLSYLRRFPVNFLKVDRSFVRNIVTSEEDAAIVRGVIEMAHALGLQAIAEGVETADQLSVLEDLGCDLGQGYYWMRPAPLGQVSAWTGIPEQRAAPSDTGSRPRTS